MCKVTNFTQLTFKCNCFVLGFYRKDHLRKHTRSHIARRVKSEVSAQSANNNTTTHQGTTVHGS